MRKVVFPGSFDPFTKGHYELVQRGLLLFDHITVALGYNTQKKRYFDVKQMHTLIEKSFEDRKKQVDVLIYKELTASFVTKLGVKFLLRGVRNATDFNMEHRISELNKTINPNLETIFLISAPKYQALSSSLIREVHSYGGDVSPYLPYSLPSDIIIHSSASSV